MRVEWRKWKKESKWEWWPHWWFVFLDLSVSGWEERKQNCCLSVEREDETFGDLTWIIRGIQTVQCRWCYISHMQTLSIQWDTGVDIGEPVADSRLSSNITLIQADNFYGFFSFHSTRYLLCFASHMTILYKLNLLIWCTKGLKSPSMSPPLATLVPFTKAHFVKILMCLFVKMIWTPTTDKCCLIKWLQHFGW